MSAIWDVSVSVTNLRLGLPPPCILTFPATSNVVDGLVVPIPMVPSFLIVKAWLPLKPEPVDIANVLSPLSKPIENLFVPPSWNLMNESPVEDCISAETPPALWSIKSLPINAPLELMFPLAVICWET